MNNISNVMPMITLDPESGSTVQAAEQSDSARDGFASMLASMWCAPVAPQPPNAEVIVDTDPSPNCVPTGQDLQPLPNDTTNLPLTGDVITPQPILTFEIKPEFGEPADTQPIVIEQTTASSAAVQTTPGVRSNDIGKVGDSYSRLPLDQVPPDPSDARLNITAHRQPTFIDPAKSLTGSAEVVLPDIPQNEVFVTVQTPVQSAQVKTAAAATDQLTAEAIKREANLAASYLAEATRDNRNSAFEAMKADVSGNASDSTSKQSSGDSDANTNNSSLNVNEGSLNFTSALKRQSVETLKEIVTPQIASQIVDVASITQPRQQRSLRLRLRPEELGQVDIQLSRDSAGKVSAQVLVEREAARAALTQSLPQLREALERAGINVDRLNVSSDSSSFSGTTREGRESTAESRRSTLSNETSANNSDTQTKERTRAHKLLSLSA